MESNSEKYNAYTEILKKELLSAMGCTEPIALAYAAAKARHELGSIPDKVLIKVSGSIIKNVKSVIVPNTNHLKGIPAAVTAGIVAGKEEKNLEVISEVTKEQINQMQQFLNDTEIEVEHIENEHIFEINVILFKKDSYCKVRIVDYHTNIVLIEKDKKIIFKREVKEVIDKDKCNRNLLNMEDIWDYVNTVNLEDIKDVLDFQIKYNSCIAEEGLKGNYGANIGKVILNSNCDDVRTRAKAKAAAGSDARMNGCEMPVVINSGSGNQGMTCSIPVIEYAKELKSNEDKLFRALVLSNLTAIHQKTGIGTLSAYCGVVSASIGAVIGVAYLQGADYNEIKHTIVNSLAISSGIVCDGAKASCAAKIAISLDAAFLGNDMYKNNQQFYNGDGIVAEGVEETIRNVGRLADRGMKGTNEEIIKIMINK